MTKDELNGILKEDGMYLSYACSGTFNNNFYVLNEGCIVVEFNGVDFIFSRDDGQGYGKKTIAALIEYANTPIKERKPKPQLYHIIIAEDVVAGRPVFTAWKKEGRLGEYSVNSYVEQYDLLYDDDLKFTVEEIEFLKSKVDEKQKQIIDIGTVKIEEMMSTKIDKKAVPF